MDKSGINSTVVCLGDLSLACALVLEASEGKTRHS